MKAQNFDFGWAKIDEVNLAAFEGLLGKPAIKVNGIYWRQVRPGFYRPLMQFRQFPVGGVSIPFWAAMGAAQYVVPSVNAANSCLNCMFFQHTRSYSLDELDANRNRQVRLASRRFVIRPISNVEEFRAKGHPAYVSFFQRTGYEYGAERLDQGFFSSWADNLFRIPEVLILGAYLDDELVGVSLTYLAGDVLCYATFFCTTDSLKLYLSDLMLHAIRSAAARSPEIRGIFTGMFKGNKGLDGFYTLRGAKCVRIPTYLQINPLVKLVLQRGAPGMYSKMLGEVHPTMAS
jgi:hypothetical protein